MIREITIAACSLAGYHLQKKRKKDTAHGLIVGSLVGTFLGNLLEKQTPPAEQIIDTTYKQI